MNELFDLLTLAKSCALEAARLASDTAESGLRRHEFDAEIPREVKARADRVLEAAIVDRLRHTGVALLSEESGPRPGTRRGDLTFVIDPLDGTVNFVRGIGQSAVSIALWERNEPVFGVICVIPAMSLAWGGRSLGAFVDGQPIAVSSVESSLKAVLCTGFPARLDLDDPNVARRFMASANRFGKIRMLGSASLSLLHVAKGAADAYVEDEIMIWDVAAGLALVQGAGGQISFSPGRHPHSLNVRADNGLLRELPASFQ